MNVSQDMHSVEQVTLADPWQLDNGQWVQHIAIKGRGGNQVITVYYDDRPERPEIRNVEKLYG